MGLLHFMGLTRSIKYVSISKTIINKVGNSMVKVSVKGLECKRCGHKWIARKEEVMLCPKCKSPYWNRERKGEIDDKTA